MKNIKRITMQVQAGRQFLNLLITTILPNILTLKQMNMSNEAREFLRKRRLLSGDNYFDYDLIRALDDFSEEIIDKLEDKPTPSSDLVEDIEKILIKEMKSLYGRPVNGHKEASKKIANLLQSKNDGWISVDEIKTRLLQLNPQIKEDSTTTNPFLYEDIKKWYDELNQTPNKPNK